jgi:hypothetical protein
MSNLDPCFRIGSQLVEPLRKHLGLSEGEVRAKALDLLARAGIADPERVGVEAGRVQGQQLLSVEGEPIGRHLGLAGQQSEHGERRLALAGPARPVQRCPACWTPEWSGPSPGPATARSWRRSGPAKRPR